MFRTGHPADYPLRIRPELLRAPDGGPLFPVLHEATPGAHGPDPQRLERHLLPGDGFPGRRARAEYLHRSGRARRAGGRAAAAGGSLFPRDRPAGAATGQRGSEGQRGDYQHRRSFRFRPRLPGPAEGRGYRLAASCPPAWKARRGRSRNCWPGWWADPGTASRSSAR